MRNDEGTSKGAHESPARKTDHTLITITFNAETPRYVTHDGQWRTATEQLSAILFAAPGHEVPDTMTFTSGRGDGGQHLCFLRPAGPIAAVKIPKALPMRLREIPRPEQARARAVFEGASHDGRGLVDFMARQVDGNRSDALYWTAHRVIEAGVLDDIGAELIRAAVATGLDAKAAKWTENSARSKAGE